MLHIGMDEAGYGPLLGPLVIGLSASRIPGTFPRGDPLRRRLRGLICTSEEAIPARGLPVPVDDSKALYRRDGCVGLARAVGAFVSAMDQAPPTDLQDWLARYSDTDPGHYATAPWFRALHRAPVPSYVWPGPLEPAFRRRGLQALDLRVFAADAGSLNDDFGRCNKARVLGVHTGNLLLSVLDRFPGEDADIWIDRHGGRRDYEPLLADWFAFASVRCLSKDRIESRYFVELPGRRLRIRFRTAADVEVLSVAWASVAAKLTRELFMCCFNDWFAARCPDLRPTAGYYQDGKRFLDDVGPFLRRAAIDRRLLVRER